MRVGCYLWDFVGKNPQYGARKRSDRANSCAFMRVVDCEFPSRCWHTVCSLLRQRC